MGLLEVLLGGFEDAFRVRLALLWQRDLRVGRDI